MGISIRFAKTSDLSAYTNLLQSTYESAYVDESIGLTKERFSKEIFALDDTQNYLKSHLINNDKQKTWLAFINLKMVGAITCIIRNKKEAELTGFYITSNYQGRGIGKKLYRLVVDFAKGRDLILDIYMHNKKSIKMYKKWNFNR